MLSKDTRVVVGRFKTEGAAVKAKVNPEILAITLKDEIGKKIQKKGYPVEESGGNGVTIDGSFIMINEGNRFLRYMIGLGSAKVHVEGAIKRDGSVLKEFDLFAKGRAGLFGGSGEKLLRIATQRVAIKIFNIFKSL